MKNNKLTSIRLTGDPQKIVNENDKLLINKLFKEINYIRPFWLKSFKNQEDINFLKRQWTTEFIKSNLIDWKFVEYGLNKLAQQKNDFSFNYQSFMNLCSPVNYLRVSVWGPIEFHEELIDQYLTKFGVYYKNNRFMFGEFPF